MMKSMREASTPMKDEDNESSARETFENMFDKEVSLQMSKRGAMGVADFMAKAVKQQIQPSTADMLKARAGMHLHPAEPAMPMGTPVDNSLILQKPRIKTLDELKLMNRSGS